MLPAEINPESLAQATKLIESLRESATDWVRVVIGIEPTWQQRKILDAAKPGARITIRSGHGTGKTSALAMLLLWFISTRTDCRIPCTAPSGHQLYDLLWSEVTMWHQKMLPEWRDSIEILTDRVHIKGEEKTRFAVARTSRPESPEALQGFHAKNLLYLIDEASGIHEKVFETAEGALSTPDCIVVMASNPTRTDGYFHRSHHRDRKMWKCITMSSAESPLVDKKFVTDMAQKYGRDSNVFRVRVLGQFPAGSDDVLIPLDLIDAALARKVDTSAFAQDVSRAGLDVARFGSDASALVVRQGGWLPHLSRWHKAGVTDTAGRCLRGNSEGLFTELNIDTIGVGSGVADICREASLKDDRTLLVRDVVVSADASDKAKFARKRDELWWLLREWLQREDSVLPAGHELIDDLVAQMSGVTFKYLSSGKIQVMSKDEMKKNLGISPDIADALCNTFDEGSFLGISEDKSGAV